jgi:16S rRNA (cytosine967-C5)-methyltransferase
MNLRAVAAQIIYQVVQKGHSLSDCLPDKRIIEPRDQALVQALCYGVCRSYFRLSAMIDLLLEKPLKTKDHDLHCLLLVGLYQLSDMRIPDFAAVSETVSAVKFFKKIWAKGLVNGILRNYQRRAEELNEKIKHTPDSFYSHPAWMIKKIQEDWSDAWEAILKANNEHPPFALRVNQQHLSRESYLKDKIGHAILETQSGVVLDTPVDVQALPGFLQGDVSVQDGAAQLAAEWLKISPGLKVLDACAAPGGKAAHLLEIESSLQLTAIDRDEKRLASINENFQRLGLSGELICHDAVKTGAWWNGELFDRILLDAPCSASGVMRRHPDIKLLRRATDIAKLQEEQRQLLTALWPLLKPGGFLLYATCSIFKQENVDIVQSFLEKTADAKEDVIDEPIGRACSVGRQILPGMHGMDGFYYARLRKCTK